MPKPPNWRVWRFSQLNNCHQRTARYHQDSNTQKWQSFISKHPNVDQVEIRLLKRIDRDETGKDYGFFLSLSKEFQDEIVAGKTRKYGGGKHEESGCGFLIKDIVLECKWMMIGGLQRQSVKSTNIYLYKRSQAWLDTPLHLCSWLSERRKQKALRLLNNIALCRKADNQKKKERWRNDADFRRRVVEKRRLHRNLNKDKTRAYASNYRKLRRKNHGIRLKMNARSRFGKVMKKVKAVQTTDSFNDFIGCSSAFLRKHIESQFEPWMNWDNYGPGWQMDHKIPLKFFDLFDLDQAKSAFHFSNLKPVSAAYNASKQARWSDV
jgi:hypothetical protein